MTKKNPHDAEMGCAGFVSSMMTHQKRLAKRDAQTTKPGALFIPRTEQNQGPLATRCYQDQRKKRPKIAKKPCILGMLTPF